MIRARTYLSVAAGLAAVLSKVFAIAPTLTFAVWLISPVGPHVRLGTHRSSYGVGMRSCTYLGSRGLIEPYDPRGCPYFLWIDRRER